MMNSIDKIIKFHSLKNDPWYSRLYKKLTIIDKEIIEDFFIQNEGNDKNELQFKINRLFIDKGYDNRPKNWALISEFLTVSNID